MKNTFKIPDFVIKDLELRYDKNEVSIYGSKEGLEKLSELISKLLKNPKQGHIHLGDYDVLTNDSLQGVVAIFDKKET